MPPSSAAASQALTDFQKTRQTADTALSAGNDKYGVSGLGSQLATLRGLTTNLQNGIRNVDPSVTGRTNGSLVTEAARSAIVNNERQPLVQQYNDTQGNANAVNDQYNQATSLAGHYADSVLSEDQNKYNQLFGNYTTALGAEQDAAKAAETKRQFDLQLADSQANRAAVAKAAAGSGLNIGGSGMAGAAAAQKPLTPQDYLAGDIQQAITSDYATKYGNGYTERQIQRLQAHYPMIDPANIAAQVYAYRKQFEKGQTSTTGGMGTKVPSFGQGAY
jgi:hypothetical protein